MSVLKSAQLSGKCLSSGAQPQSHSSHSPSRKHRWFVVTWCMSALFLFTACASTHKPTPKLWIDPYFAEGQVAIQKLELLPMNLAVNIDGVGASTWQLIRQQQAMIAQKIESELIRQMGREGYQIALGHMGQKRLRHLLQEIDRVAKVSDGVATPANINPSIIAGGIPGTDGVLVIEGYANMTTTGKRAAQAAVAVLIVTLIVIVVIAAIAAIASQKSKSRKSSKRARRGSRNRTVRSPRNRSLRTRRIYRRKRALPRRYVRVPARRRATTRFYRGNYRYRGRRYTYRGPRFRPIRRRTRIHFYFPNVYSYQTTSPPTNEQPFFSSSYLDLRVSVVQKQTGILLWHNARRWSLNPNNRNQLREMAKNLFKSLPRAKAPIHRPSDALPTPKQLQKENPSPAPPADVPNQPPPGTL